MKTRLSALVIFPFIALACAASAADWTVGNVTALRNALTLAQNNGAEDVITLQSGDYLITAPLNYVPTENQPLTIRAAEGGQAVLDGQNASQILIVDTSALADDTHADIYLEGLVFRNGAKSSGTGVGGVRIHTTAANIVLTGVDFDHNFGNDQSGGGLYANTMSGAISIVDGNFSNNSGPILGGAVFAESSSGAVILSNNRFSGNASYVYAGAVYAASTSANVILTNNRFNDNSSDNGGALSASTSVGTLTITNNTFVSNFSVYNGGAMTAAMNHNSARARLYNNIFWNNTAGSDGNDVWVDDDGNGDSNGSEVLIVHNLALDLAFRVGDNVVLEHTLTEDPQLSADLHLTAKSPCIDAGDNTAPLIPSEDFEGDNRILDGDGDGFAAVDIGADEFQIVLASPTGQLVFNYLPTETPLIHLEADHNKPFAVGDVAEGKLTLRVKLPSFTAPVDLYLLFYWVPFDPEHIYQFTAADQFQPLDAGLAPWKTAVIESVDETLVNDLTVTSWPSGTYYLAVVAARDATLEDFYMWLTYFVLP